MASYVYVSAGSGELLRAIDTGSPITGLSISGDDQWIAASLADTSVGVWDLNSGVERYRLNDHADLVTDVEFSPDGSVLASSSADTSVRLWDVATGQLLHTLAEAY